MKDIVRLRKTLRFCKYSDYKNSHGQSIRMAATLYSGNKETVTSVNQKKTHPLMAFYNSQNIDFDREAYIHAEMACLLSAGWKQGYKSFSGSTMYIARSLSCGGNGLARPCKACMAALKDAGVKKIVYTTYDGYAIEYLE